MARLLCLGSLLVFGLIYMITSNMWLFYDSAAGRPRITQMLGPVGILCIPVALVSGVVWLLATYFTERRPKTWRNQHDQPLEEALSRGKHDGDATA